uniref:Uncharacterized protein n=1 Tax=Parascaris univalens TaxID=6257 RepID=A0A915A318_PARUN
DSGHLKGVADGVNDESEQGMRHVCGQLHRNTSGEDPFGNELTYSERTFCVSLEF